MASITRVSAQCAMARPTVTMIWMSRRAADISTLMASSSPPRSYSPSISSSPSGDGSTINMWRSTTRCRPAMLQSGTASNPCWDIMRPTTPRSLPSITSTNISFISTSRWINLDGERSRNNFIGEKRNFIGMKMKSLHVSMQHWRQSMRRWSSSKIIQGS